MANKNMSMVKVMYLFTFLIEIEVISDGVADSYQLEGTAVSPTASQALDEIWHERLVKCLSSDVLKRHAEKLTIKIVIKKVTRKESQPDFAHFKESVTRFRFIT